jgi:hypothetical protein
MSAQKVSFPEELKLEGSEDLPYLPGLFIQTKSQSPDNQKIGLKLWSWRD